MRVRLALLVMAGLLWSTVAVAQLPADAVMLDKVKIPEKQKSDQLCPVYLEPPAADGPTWEHKGVKYKGAKPDAAEKFKTDPDGFAKKAAEQRYINNFMESMSTVWCPVMDEITPGGMTQWKKLGYTWESCCQFCDENYEDQNFVDGLERLKKRAKESYDLMMKNGGIKYTEGAKSPVEGAIKQ